MSELILRTRHADGRVLAQPIADVAHLVVEPGAAYTIVDAETDSVPAGLVFEREDEDLEIQLDGESIVVLDDFYDADMAATFGADGTLGDTQSLTLTSADLPAVSAAGAAESATDLPEVSAGGAVGGAAGAAAFASPATLGGAGLVGAGAAGVGAGVGMSAADAEDDPATDTSIVVFDLAEDGDSSDHSDQTFDADTTYTIYIRVPSEGGGIINLQSGERWSGGENLGADDLIVLVGDDGPVTNQFNASDMVSEFSTEGYLYWRGSESMWLSVTGSGSFYRSSSNYTSITISTESGGTTFTSTSTYTYTSTRLWTAQNSSSESTEWMSTPNQGVTTAQAYLTTLPVGVLTSQGLA